jgi:hypothetical protein
MNDNDLHYVRHIQPTRFSPTDQSSKTNRVLDLVLTTKELKHQTIFNIVGNNPATSSDGTRGSVVLAGGQGREA